MIPNLLWHTFSKAAGIDVIHIGKLAAKIDSKDSGDRLKAIEQITTHIYASLQLKYDYQPMFKKFNLKKRLPVCRKHGAFLYIIYMLIKLIYLMNLIGQLFVMNTFFGFQYHKYGFEFLKNFLDGNDMTGIERAFPR